MLLGERGNTTRQPRITLLVFKAHEREPLGSGPVGCPDLYVGSVGKASTAHVQDEVALERGAQEVARATLRLRVLHELPPLRRAAIGRVLLHVGARLGKSAVHVERLA